MKSISDTEVEKRLRLWADITTLSLELKRALLKKRHPKLNEDELSELIHKEYFKIGAYIDEK